MHCHPVVVVLVDGKDRLAYSPYYRIHDKAKRVHMHRMRRHGACYFNGKKKEQNRFVRPELEQNAS